MERQYICNALLRITEDPQGAGLMLTDPTGQRVTDVDGYFAQAVEHGITMGFFLDETQTDAGHEMAIGLVRRYTQVGRLPVMAGGRTKRLEDVKKYIYTGARAAMLREDDPEEMAVYEEAVSRFGKARVVLYCEKYFEGSGESKGLVTVQETQVDLQWSQFKLGPDGLLPCIVQDVHTGQVLDLQGEGRRISLDELRVLNAKKTGALLYNACECGAVLAGASQAQREAARRYGSELGIAFQITDDILDVIGDEATVGKEVRHDAESEKATWPAFIGLEASKELAQKHCDAAEAALEGLFSGPDAEFLRETSRKLVNRTH